MKQFLFSLALAGLLFASRSAQAGVDITLGAGVLQDDDGSTLDDGSTMMLIVDADGDGFGALTSTNSASETSFLNDAGDVLLKRWAMDSGTSGADGAHVEGISFDLGGSLGAGDQLILVWYSGLMEASNPSAPGPARRFGTFRDVDWVVPPDGNSISLNFVTTDLGGSYDPAEGAANQVTTGQQVNQPPTAVCQNVTKSANGNCQAAVTPLEVDGGSSDPDGTITNRILSPTGPFSKGNTPVTLTVIDNQGASNSCLATITVQDTTPPTITCPSNLSTTVPAGQTSALVNYPTPTRSDNCPGVTASCVPSSGSSFPLGATTVNCTATDGSTNTSPCSFTVTVNSGQNQSPVAQCKNVTNAASANCQAIVTAAQVDNGSFDPDGTISNRLLNPAGPFNLGSTPVTLTVVDNLGASNSCNATVVVQDQTPPSITCPGNVSTSVAAGQTSAVVNYPAPSSSDNCSSPTVTCVPPSGSTFALGSTNVNCRAVDAANRTNTCSFSVTVGSGPNQPPVAQCRNVTNAANANCQAAVTAAQVNNGSFDPDGTISNLVLNPAGPFNLGSTPVTLTVVDNLGASNSCNATVVVQDQTAPSITCPGNVSTTIPAGQTSAVVNYPAPSASDNCSSPTVTCVPPSGSTFDLGSTNVNCRAIDAANRTNTCSFSVTVNSSGANQPPVAQCKNITNAANANCQAAVTVSQVNNGSFDPDGTISNRVLNPAGPFNLGTTPVTLTVFDNQGASNSCSATITVEDQTPPTVSCPSNIVVTAASSENTAVVNYPAPAASDNCSNPEVVCSPLSGSSFPLGMTTVNCTAMDDAGNPSSCSFKVTVNASGENQPPVALCQNLTLVAGPRCMATTQPRAADGGSFDPDGRIVSRTLTPPGPYPLGDTPVILTVTDNKGATDSCPASITVVDQTPPTIQCPPDKMFTVPAGRTQRVVKFGVKAKDNCFEPTVECSPVSGSFFPLGTTSVNCIAADGAGQTNSCSFTVTVETNSSCRTISQLMAQIEASNLKDGEKKKLEDKLKEVIKKLDERDKDCGDDKSEEGEKKCAEALKKLDEFIRDASKFVEEDKLDQATGEGWIGCANHLKSQIVCPCGPDLTDIRL